MVDTLILGGAGYIGTKLTCTMANGYNFNDTVYSVDNFFYDNKEQAQAVAALKLSLGSQYTFKYMDVLDIDKVLRLIDDIKPKQVIHLAALVGFPTCDEHYELANKLHIDVTAAVAGHCRIKGIKFLYPTTNSGYGSTDGTSICTEETPLNPISHYGKTKAEAERYVIENDGISFRLATVFGASYRMRRDLLVNNFVWKAYKDKYNVIYEGNNMRNYVHINDVCYMFNLSLEHYEQMKGQVFNFGNDDINMSKLQLAKEIQKIVPHDIIEREIGTDPDKRNYIVSSAKIKKIFGKNFYFTPLLDGIGELLHYYKIIDRPIYGNY